MIAGARCVWEAGSHPRDLLHAVDRGVRCTLVRGGTSRGLFLLAEDLPPVGRARDDVLKSLMGTSCANQIDGLGGGHPQTMKVAIVGPPSRADADVDYTFAQIGVGEASISYDGNCGNILSGVGPFAIEHGLVEARGSMAVVRVHNTNTDTIVRVELAVQSGRAAIEGDYRIDGVPGTGARITLDFAGAVGSTTGKLFPTGQPADVIEVSGMGALEVSVVDVGNPTVFVRAGDLGLAGDESVEYLARFDRLEAIRGHAARLLGLVDRWRDAASISPFLPFLALVAAAQDSTPDVDLVARFYTAGVVHPACPGTAAACLAAAARLEGTVVASVARRAPASLPFRFAHPAGKMEVEILMNPDGSLGRAAIGRTQRKLMEGIAFSR